MAAFVWSLAVLLVASTMVTSQEEECDIYSDMLFILDKSASIKDDQWVIMKESVTSMAENLNIGKDKIRVGLMLFANSHHKKWCFDTYETKEEVIEAIKNLECPECGRGQTSTGIAMEYARKKMFTTECGLRGDEFKKTIVLLTDGKSTEVQKKKKPEDWVETQSKLLAEATKADIIAVGIGNYRYRELLHIASKKEYVVAVEDFSQLSRYVNAITYTASGCPPPPPPYRPDCKLDLVFLMDKSSSIKHLAWKLEKAFVKEVIKHYKISEDSVRVAITLYATDVHDRFCFNNYTDRADLLKAINKLKCRECERGRTAIGASLQYARETVLTESCGDRKDVDDFVILITDGKSTEDESYWTNQAKMMKNSVKHFFTIGVGKSKLKNLRKMAIDQNNALYYLDFEKIIDTIDASLQKSGCNIPIDRDMGQCDIGWKYDVWKKRCIKYFNGRSKFKKAHEICEEKGDVMPTVEDNNDAGFFRLLIQSNSRNGKTNEAWVPLTGDDKDLTKWTWPSGKKLGKRNRWSKGQPVSKSGTCTVMYGAKSRWKNVKCNKKYSSFCARTINRNYMKMD